MNVQHFQKLYSSTHSKVCHLQKTYIILHPFFFLSGGSLASTVLRRCTHSAMSGRSFAAGAQHSFTKSFSSAGSFLFHLPYIRVRSGAECKLWQQNAT